MGVAGLLVVLTICLTPFLRLALQYLTYKVTAALCATVAQPRLSQLIDAIGGAFGLVLGMTKRQIFFKVTLLQMIKRIVPPMSNEIITLVKDTSIARIVSLQEVIWAGYAFMKSSHGYSGLIWPLFFTGVYFLVFNGLLTILFNRIEKKLDYFQ